MRNKALAAPAEATRSIAVSSKITRTTRRVETWKVAIRAAIRPIFAAFELLLMLFYADLNN